MAHPPTTGKEQFEQAQAILAALSSRTAHKAYRRLRPYALRGVLLCGLCDRRMTGNWNNDEANTGAGSRRIRPWPTTSITPNGSPSAPS